MSCDREYFHGACHCVVHVPGRFPRFLVLDTSNLQPALRRMPEPDHLTASAAADTASAFPGRHDFGLRRASVHNCDTRDGTRSTDHYTASVELRHLLPGFLSR